MIQQLIKPKTTASIMATFTSTIKQLHTAADAHAGIAAKERNKAQEAVARAEVAEAEVAAASAAASKLEAFLA